MDYVCVSDFDTHVQYMEGFHKRYMASNVVLKAWAKMVRELDIEIIAPQHGAMFKGKEMSNGLSIGAHSFSAASIWLPTYSKCRLTKSDAPGSETFRNNSFAP